MNPAKIKLLVGYMQNPTTVNSKELFGNKANPQDVPRYSYSLFPEGRGRCPSLSPQLPNSAAGSRHANWHSCRHLKKRRLVNRKT